MKKTQKALPKLFILLAILATLFLTNCKKGGNKTSEASKIGSYLISGGYGSKNYSGNCVTYVNYTTGGINVTIKTNGGDSITIYNMPTASNGSYNLIDLSLVTSYQNQLYAKINLDNSDGTYKFPYQTPSVIGLSSFNGTVIKTGSKTFTFNSQMFISALGTPFGTVSGNGLY